MSLFSGISQHVIEIEKKDSFCSAVIDKIANCSFESVFEQKYDFFSQIFEYLIKDYNKDFGKYAEYYTPHAIATIMARLLVGDNPDLHSVECYDPSAGTGTLMPSSRRISAALRRDVTAKKLDGTRKSSTVASSEGRNEETMRPTGFTGLP